MNRLSTIVLIVTIMANTVVLAKEPIKYRVTVKERKADQLFQLQSYQSCVELYHKVLDKQENNVRVTAKLAETYYALNQYSAAKPLYEFVIEDSSATEPKHLWHYAQVLASLRYTDEATYWLTEFLQLRPNHRAARQQLYGLKNREIFFADSSLYSVEPATFNSSASDFSPVFMGDDLVFTSARQQSRLGKKYHRDGSSFLRLYTYDSIHQGENVKPLFNHNLPMHEGSGAFFSNNAEFIFTANRETAEQVSDMQRVNRLQLFRTELNSAGEWTEPQSILLNSKNYSIGHPAISEGGDTLYFTSNMPGGFGGTDIYVSYLLNESWSTPSNLGSNINTEADEMFPTLFEDYLYFSSKGHAGLGGLDIYQVSVSGLHKDEVKNVGFPINSSSDDFGLITRDSLSGYFSSNRSGNDDIFLLSPNSSKDAISLTVQIIDWNTNEPIPSVEVFLDHQETRERQPLVTDEEGKAKVITDNHSVWNVSGNLDNKPWEFLPIHTDQLLLNKDNIVEIFLSQDDETVEVKDFIISPVALTVRVIDWDSNEPISDVEIFLDNQKTNERHSMVTDGNGNVKIITDNRSVWNVTGTLNNEPWEFLPIHTNQLLVSEDNTVEIFLFQNTEAIQALDIIVFDRHDNKGDILVSIDSEIYQFEQVDNQNYLVQGDKCISLFRSNASDGAEKGLEERMDEIFFQEGVPVRSITVINTVYFDFDQSSVRKDASTELRKLAEVLTKHTNLTIYLDAHTDSRGSNNYNMQLSKRRANRVQKYLAQHGVNTNQVMLQYYGEKQLRNKCSDNTLCDTKGHQLNRRVEFKVVDFASHSTPMIAG